jgi:hypothetical protein
MPDGSCAFSGTAGFVVSFLFVEQALHFLVAQHSPQQAHPADFTALVALVLVALQVAHFLVAQHSPQQAHPADFTALVVLVALQVPHFLLAQQSPQQAHPADFAVLVALALQVPHFLVAQQSAQQAQSVAAFFEQHAQPSLQQSQQESALAVPDFWQQHPGSAPRASMALKKRRRAERIARKWAWVMVSLLGSECG